MFYSHKFCVAPMVGWTNRFGRFFYRLISPSSMLYTEMICAKSILLGNRKRILSFSSKEKPLGIQIGGKNISDCVTCCKIAEDYGYDEVNLNVGCPSSKTLQAHIGASLMGSPDLVAELFFAMKSAVKLPVTIKSRLGINEQNVEETFPYFIEKIRQAGCKSIFVHARKAFLTGFSPRKNRVIPPLNYNLVRKIKKANPELEIVINGGITDIEQVRSHLNYFDGVMLGTKIIRDPYFLSTVEEKLFGGYKRKRKDILLTYLEYASERKRESCFLKTSFLLKPLFNLYKNTPYNKLFLGAVIDACKKDEISSLHRFLDLCV